MCGQILSLHFSRSVTSPGDKACVCVCWRQVEGLLCCPFPGHLVQDMSGEGSGVTSSLHYKTPTWCAVVITPRTARPGLVPRGLSYFSVRTTSPPE